MNLNCESAAKALIVQHSPAPVTDLHEFFGVLLLIYVLLRYWKIPEFSYCTHSFDHMCERRSGPRMSHSGLCSRMSHDALCWVQWESGVTGFMNGQLGNVQDSGQIISPPENDY